MNNRSFARIAREQAPKLLEQAIKVLVAGAVVQDEVSDEQKPSKAKPSLGRRLASTVLVRVATRSVPGAIIVSGGLIAKTLHDRHQAKKAQAATGKFGKPRK